MYRKDLLDNIQEWAILTLTVTASVFMLAASYWCMTYQAPRYPDHYEVTMYTQCASSEAD